MTAFGDLVAQYRKAAVPWLSQEGLARAIAVDTKTISNIERGTVQWPQKDTVRRLVDHFGLTGDARKEFEAAARQRDAPWTVERAVLAGPPRGDNPHTWLAFIVATLDERGVAAARAAVGQWQARTAVDGSWLDWVDRLLELTGEGRLPRATQRPLPASDPSVFLAREQETASLAGFLDRVRQGRGGLTLIMGPSGIGKSRLAAKVLPGWTSDCRTEWVTLDRGEAGYQGWRRLLSPLWATVRRTELAPASLAAQSRRLNDILLPGPGQAARRFFRGEVAAAIAALLAQVSVTRPVVLVIDDAQRGGISSDQLLLEVARRVNAFSVGISAAFRPD